jgi:hypothetical protein
MRDAFERHGAVHGNDMKNARLWIISKRKKTSEPTLYYDEVWSELWRVARFAKQSSDSTDEAWTKYARFAACMACVMQPLLDSNRDSLTRHDFGFPLSTAGMGCVEAAWRSELPYDVLA